MRSFRVAEVGQGAGKRIRRLAAGKARRRRRTLEALERLEPRTLLAILPPPTVTLRRNVSNPAEAILGTNESSPSIAVSPNDPMKLVAAWTEGVRFPDTATPIATRAAYSTDGGASWTPLSLPPNLYDPALPIGTALTESDRLIRSTDAMVAFDRFDNVYLLAAQQSEANVSGALVLQKYSFRGAVPTQVLRDKVVYAWTQDAAIQPYLAVDATLPRYVDSGTGLTVTNPNSGNVYVAWATDDGVGSPNSIKLVVSSDGGQTFSARRTINDEQAANGTFFQPTAPGVQPRNQSGNSGAQRNVLPRLVVSQGTADGRVAPGQVTIVWDDFGTGPAFPATWPVDTNPVVATPPDLIRADRVVGGVGQTFTTAGVIRALPNTPTRPTEVITDFPIVVNVTDPRFTTLSDLDFRIAIANPGNHDLTVELIAPDGRRLVGAGGGPALTTAAEFGVGLGVGPDGRALGTVFDEEAITPYAAATGARVGNFFVPYRQPPPAGQVATTFNLSDFYGRTAAQLRGTWTVRITNRSILTDPDGGGPQPAAPPQLVEAALVLTSGLVPGADRVVTTTHVNGAISTDTPFSGDKQPYPLVTAAQFDRGVGPAPALAADNTLSTLLGSHGRIYLAYVDYVRATPANLRSPTITQQVDNTDIFLRYSDDGGLTWSVPRLVNDDIDSNRDGFTESLVNAQLSFGRPQFMPSLAVDQATGTLAVSFYDARRDAARARVAMTLTTSIDGGLSFSPQNLSFVNAPNAPFDAIERRDVVLAPIPDNLSEGNPEDFIREGEAGLGFGDRQALAIHGGSIYVAWSGNENGGNQGLNLLDVRVARAATAAGPRVIASTMGPVQATTVDGVTFNAATAPDGAPVVEGFVVTFDRPVDARTFTTDDVTVYFRRPSDPPSSFGERIAAASVTPLDLSGPLVGGSPIRATTFLVRLQGTPAQLSRVGTYSYAVGPNILDLAGSATTTLVPDPAPVTATTTPLPIWSAAQGLPLEVPAGQTVDAVLDVSGFRADDLLASLEATVSIQVPRARDLILSLIGPTGRTVRLATNRGGSGSDFLNTVFSDSATLSIADPGESAPFNDVYRPEQPLAGLAGAAINGAYRLRIQNQGTAPAHLLAFSVKARTGSSVGTTPLAVPDEGRALATLDVAGFLPSERIRSVVGRITTNHPAPGQLALTLVAPDGTRVPFVPDVPLTGLADKPVNGTYRLEAVDTVAGLAGEIQSFALEITAYAEYALTTGSIPDGGAFASRVTLAGYSPAQRLSKALVTTTVTHPRSRDLQISLQAPGALPLVLASNRGGSTANAYAGTTFDDAASQAIETATPPFVGSYRPEQPLADLAGRNPNGEWTLRFSDTVLGQTGTVASARLTIETQSVVSGRPLAIPQGTARAISTLTIGPAATVAGVELTVDIAHPEVRELTLNLVAPNGTRVPLVDSFTSFSQPGGPNSILGANLRATFAAGAATLSTGVAPYEGRFSPIGDLTTLVGGPANGVWQLEAVDAVGNPFTGVIRSWSLTIRTATPFASVDVPRAIPNDAAATPVTSTLGIFGLPPGTRIADVAGSVAVTLNVTHPAVQELDITLVSPGGVEIPLVVNGGTPTGGNFTNTTISNAPNAVPFSTAGAAAPYNSSVAPFRIFLPESGSLDVLRGTDPTGVWTLRVVDRVGGAGNTNAGTVTGWSLSIQSDAHYGQTPTPIPASSITVATLHVADFPTTAVLDQVEAQVGIDYPSVGNLALYLVGPDGTRVPLAVNQGGLTANVSATFRDDAPTPVGSAANLIGDFQPEEPLANFAGKTGAAVNGIWRLEVVNAGVLPGLVNNFQLALRAGAVLGLLPGPIPDGAVATALVEVSGYAPGETVDQVEVFVDATHPDLTQLELTLVAPDGARVRLAELPAGAPAGVFSGANLTGTIFTDQASRGIADTPPTALGTYAPFTGRFRPIEPLASLRGRNPNGTWKLEVRDKVSGEVGTLDGFALRLRTRPEFAATDTPKAIPNPSPAPTPISSSITISGYDPADPIADATVAVSITHPQVQDLRVTLVAPDGTRVRLVTNQLTPGVSGADLRTRFDDAAAQEVTAGAAPYAGVFRPQFPAALRALAGKPLNGTWTLEVVDTQATPGGPPATLDGWSIGLLPASRLDQVPVAINDLSTAVSTLRVTGAPADRVVNGATVEVTIDHPQPSELALFLVAPNGLRLPLATGQGSGTYQVAGFDGVAVNGSWRLEVVDRGVIFDPATGEQVGTTEGELVSWTLTLGTAQALVTPGAGNPMDQDTDARPAEPGSGPGDVGTDAYAAPRSFAGIANPSSLDRGINGTPFQFPFDPMTLPLIVPGPRVVETQVAGVPKVADNLVTDQAVTAFDLTFDRDINPASFTGEDIVRLDGPLGTIGPNPADEIPARFRVEPLGPRVFRIHFETPAGAPLPLTRSGTYALVLGPQILSAAGDAMDANQNAGLDALRGVVDPATGTTVALTVAASGSQTGLAIPAGTATNPTVIRSRITVDDDFLIQDLNLQLNIAHSRVPDLEARLVAVDPSGDPANNITVLLFSGVGNTGTRTDFRDTIFDDQAPTPIQNGGPPFLGSYSPQVGLPDPSRPGVTGVPLDFLRNRPSARTWELEITNRGATAGVLNGWSLTFRKPVPGTGLGEPVADRTTASFRIFNMAPENPLAASTWTAVGPAGIGARGPGLNAEVAGRVNAVAVDPSDPSGNTVYAAAATGGIWKTTNFLTTSPAGPTWIPLLDEAPTRGMRLSSIAVVGRNNDPNQSILFVGTGDGPALGDPLRPSGLTARGIGLLRSLDGGRTWTLLDSTNNDLPFASRDHVFSSGNGTAVFKVVADPRLTPSGEAIVYAAVSDVGPDGRDTYTTVNGGLWRSVDSGRTWRRMRAGQATDVVLDLNSRTGAIDGGVQRIYAAFRNDGVYESPNRGQTWNAMPGVTGKPLVQNADFAQPQPVPVIGPPQSQAFQTGQQALATPNSTRTTPNSYTTNANFVATPATAGEPRLGRIMLAKPELTGDALRDQLYQGWLYAAVLVHNQGDLVQFPPPLAPPSALWGIFVTKDFGQNWTRIMMPDVGVPTNWFDPDNPLENTPQIDPTGSGTPAGSYYFKGNFSASLAVDPTNPNVIYFGGTNMFGTTGMVRVDTTGLADPHAFYLSNDDADQEPTQGQFRTYAGYAGPSSPADASALNEADEVGNPLTLIYSITRAPIFPQRDPILTPPGAYSPKTTPFLNLIRDPARPFQANATVLVSGVATFNNPGTKAAWIPFEDITKPDPFAPPSTDTWSRPTRGQHQILTLRDPLTGRARLILANDNGVYTAVDEGDGTLVGSIGGVVDPTTTAGNVTIVNGSRNGNLAIAQFRSGAAQPSELSAQIGTLLGQGMFYGAGEDTGQPASDPEIVTPGAPGYGNVSWVGLNVEARQALQTRETTYWVATQQNSVFNPATGRLEPASVVYHFANPEGLVEADYIGDRFHPSTDFFQVNGVSRTFRLVQTDFGGDVPDAQWPFRRGLPFAVNPLNGDQLLIGSAQGRVFGSETQGREWFEIGNPTVLNGRPISALAFGAPLPVPPGGSQNTNDYLLVGTEAVGGVGGTTGGQIYVTFTGGGTPGVGNQWTNLSAGLDGSTIRAIATSPTSGSFEAYAVTERGVYWMPNTQAATATWQPITGNLFNLTHQPFDDPALEQTRLRSLTALQVDWRYVIPDDFANPTGPTHPILYVAGDGGVFRSLDRGRTWSPFPDVAFNGSPLGDGGGLPNAFVTDLDLSLGLVNPTTGRPDVSTGPNLLLATTYGRGQFAVRLAPLVFPNPPDAVGDARILRIEAASDSGLFDDDHVTNVRTPHVIGLSEQTAFGNVVYITLYDLTDPANPRIIGGLRGDPNDPANLANTAIQTDSAGRFRVQIDPGMLTTDGLKTIGVQATNQSGTKGNMATIQFVLDTTPPSAPLRPELLLVSDTGLATNDQITRINQNLQFQVTFAPEDAGSRVTLYRGTGAVGTPVQGASPLTLADPGPLADGLYAYRAGLRDLAGNDGPLSDPLFVRVDTTRPARPSPPDLVAEDDTGISATDNITSLRQPRFTGVAEANPFPDPNDPAGPGAPRRPNRVELIDATNTVIGAADIASTGVYVVQPFAPLPNGTYTLRTRVVDRAGNISDPSTPLSVQILQVTHAAPTLRLVPADDSGLVGDNITNVNRNLRVEGQGVAGLYVQLIDVDGSFTGTAGAVITPTGTMPPAFVQADRNYLLTLPGNDAANPGRIRDGVYTLQTRTFDVAGNSSLSPVLVVTVVTVGPPQQPTLVLLPEDDTGTIGPDSFGVYTTSNRRPGFRVSVAGAAAGTAVDLIGPDGVMASGQIDANGQAVLRPAQDMVNGTIALRARLRDTAGNSGPDSTPLILRIATVDGDLDRNARADLATYQPTTGGFTTSVVAPAPAGGSFADVPLAADLDGDGKVDLGYFRPATATWVARPTSQTGSITRSVGLGLNSGGRPVPVLADFDGDGRADLAVFDQGTAVWTIQQSQTGSTVARQFGGVGDLPVAADYDGDGRADLAVYRPAEARFYITLSRGGGFDVVVGPLGASPLAADFDGDGKADPAVYVAAAAGGTGQFLAALRAGGTFTASLGQPGDIPVPQDYDGDGKADPAIFRPSSAQWIINGSGGGGPITISLGAPDDVPLPAPYFPYRTPTPPTLQLRPQDDTGTPGDGATTVRRPRFVGTGRPGLIVRLVDLGGTVTGTPGSLIPLPGGGPVTVTPAGTFEIGLPADLALGTHQIAARTSDTVGNYVQSAPLMVRIRSEDEPAITTPTLGLLPADDTGTPGDGATTITRPRLTGTGTPGLSVRLVDLAGTITGTAGALLPLEPGVSSVVVQPNGTFVIGLPTPLPPGVYPLAARTSDAVGNSAQSAAFRLEILPGGGPGPVLPVPGLAFLDDRGTIGDGRTTARQPRFLATAPAGTTLQLIALGDGSVLTAATTDAAGSAILQVPVALPNGLVRVAARAVDPLSGTVGTPSPEVAVRLVTAAGDYSGDGRADLATFLTSNGRFRSLILPGAGAAPVPAGTRRGDVPIQGDFDGDGKADLGVYRPATATWTIALSSGGTLVRRFGLGGAVPVVGDYDGDGRDDLAVFRRGDATWQILRSSDGGTTSTRFGTAGSTAAPIPADFDGDGRTDLATYHQPTATWTISLSTGGTLVRTYGRARVDLATPADFDGDGRADLAVFRPDNGTFYVERSDGGGAFAIAAGASGRGVMAVPQDYDADGKADAAVFQPRGRRWLIVQSSNDQRRTFRLGSGAADVAVAAPVVPYRTPTTGTRSGAAGVRAAAWTDALPNANLAETFARPRRRRGR
jgi:subtilisin-like proprotein convertase family protein